MPLGLAGRWVLLAAACEPRPANGHGGWPRPLPPLLLLLVLSRLPALRDRRPRSGQPRVGLLLALLFLKAQGQ